MTKNDDATPPFRLVVDMPAGYGDSMMCSALFAEARKAWPECQIEFLCYPGHEALVKGPDVQVVGPQLCASGSRRDRPPHLPIGSLEISHPRDFDGLWDGRGRSAWWHWMRILFRKAGLPFDPFTARRVCYLEAGEILQAKRLLADLPRPLTAIHPYTNFGRVEKLWPLSKWNELLDQVEGTKLLLGNGGGIIPRRSDLLDLRGKHTPRQTLALLSQVDLTICVDSFVMHAAEAAGCPRVVAIWGGTCPQIAGLFMDGVINVEPRLRSCGNDRCWAFRRCPHPCINGVTVKEVARAVKRLMAPPATGTVDLPQVTFDSPQAINDFLAKAEGEIVVLGVPEGIGPGVALASQAAQRFEENPRLGAVEIDGAVVLHRRCLNKVPWLDECFETTGWALADYRMRAQALGLLCEIKPAGEDCPADAAFFSERWSRFHAGIAPAQTVKRREGVFAETPKIRARLEKYCVGSGLDLACGEETIVPSAVGLDYAVEYGLNEDLPTAATLIGPWEELLPAFCADGLDYLYSSHLLEDYADIGPVLPKWLRVIKPGGLLILHLPVEAAFKAHCKAIGQLYNSVHKQNWTGYRDFMARLPAEVRGMVELVKGGDDVRPMKPDDPGSAHYSFFVVLRKTGRATPPPTAKTLAREKRLVATTWLTHDVDEMLGLTLPRMKAYAAKCGADFFIQRYTRRDLPMFFQRFNIAEQFEAGYDRILILDGDMLVREDAPDLFDLVPEEAVAMTRDVWAANARNKGETRRNGVRRFYTDHGIPWRDDDPPGWFYGNIGTCLFPKERRALYEVPYDSWNGGAFQDQDLINARTRLGAYEMFELERRWNCMFYADLPQMNPAEAWILHAASGSRYAERVRRLSVFDALWKQEGR